MKSELGNLPPNTELILKYTYIEELEVTMNKFYKLRFGSTITSRYLPLDIQANSDQEYLSNVP